MLIFFTQFSLAGVFTEAIFKNDFKAVKELIDHGYHLAKDADAVPTAISTGSLEMLLFLLKHGADPNTFTHTYRYNGLNIRHVLGDTSSICQIVALLSYGAVAHDGPNGYEWDYNMAIVDKRWLHVAVYYYWERMLVHKIPTPPNSISELNTIIMSLPLLTIKALAVFTEHQFNLEDIFTLLPNYLKSFFRVFLNFHEED